jgi:hypothetical protein
MNIQANGLRKFAILIFCLFLIDGIGNIINYGSYAELVWRIIQTLIVMGCIVILYLNKQWLTNNN